MAIDHIRAMSGSLFAMGARELAIVAARLSSPSLFARLRLALFPGSFRFSLQPTLVRVR